MKALFIPEEGGATVIEIRDGAPGFLRDLYAALAAEAVEAVPLTGQWSAWVDEEGIRAHRGVNRGATGLARDVGMPVDLRGPVVLLGVDGAEGRSIGLTGDQVEGVCRRLRGPAAGAAGSWATGVPG
jgi:hypothetical protein